MPVSVKQLVGTEFASLLLKLVDADAPRPQQTPLSGLHVQVQLLSAAGKTGALLHDGRTDSKGEVRMRMPVPETAARGRPKPLPKIQVVALDLEGEELKKSILQPVRGKALPAVEVSVKSQIEKIDAPLKNGARNVLGEGSPQRWLSCSDATESIRSRRCGEPTESSLATSRARTRSTSTNWGPMRSSSWCRSTTSSTGRSSRRAFAASSRSRSCRGRPF